MDDDPMAPAPGSPEMLLDLPAEPSSMPVARKTIRKTLIAWGYELPLVHDCTLVISEIVTNAIAAAPGRRVHLRCAIHNGAPLLECWDPSPELPTARPGFHTAETGRGLTIIAAYAKETGTRPSPTGTGKVVWAQMPA